MKIDNKEIEIKEVIPEKLKDAIHNAEIHNNYVKLTGRDTDKERDYDSTPEKLKDAIHNAEIHKNYVKLTGIDTEKDKPRDNMPEKLKDAIHRSQMHNNLIKILNSGSKSKSNNVEESTHDSLSD